VGSRGHRARLGSGHQGPGGQSTGGGASGAGGGDGGPAGEESSHVTVERKKDGGERKVT
jgi:hypothetical protein